MPPPLKTVQTSDRVLNQIQDNTAAVVNPIVANPILNGILITEVELTTGNNVINHKLGRPLEGWILVRQRSQADIWDDQDDNATPQYTLDLVTDADTSVDLYIF